MSPNPPNMTAQTVHDIRAASPRRPRFLRAGGGGTSAAGGPPGVATSALDGSGQARRGGAVHEPYQRARPGGDRLARVDVGLARPLQDGGQRLGLVAPR